MLVLTGDNPSRFTRIHARSFPPRSHPPRRVNVVITETWIASQDDDAAAAAAAAAAVASRFGAYLYLIGLEARINLD